MAGCSQRLGPSGSDCRRWKNVSVLRIATYVALFTTLPANLLFKLYGHF